jgi:hypothetical protein
LAIGREFTALLQLLVGVFANRLEHAVAGAVVVFFEHDE